MDILTDQALLDRIDAFLQQNDMPPTRFGVEAMGDPALVPSLRGEGKFTGKPRSLSLRNAAKVIEFMETYEPKAAAA